MASRTYLRRKRKKHDERQARYSAAGVAGRQRKMDSARDAAELVGTVTFSGPIFGGDHVLRCFEADWYSESDLMLEIDGTASKARTVGGVRRLLAARLVTERGAG